MSTITAWSIVIAIGTLCGGLLGIVKGFAQASNRDVLAGVRPRLENRALLAFFRPTKELTSWEAVWMLLFLLGWVVIFIGICALPFVVAGRLGVSDAAIAASVVALIMLFAVAPIGARLWAKVPKHAV